MKGRLGEIGEGSLASWSDARASRSGLVSATSSCDLVDLGIAHYIVRCAHRRAHFSIAIANETKTRTQTLTAGIRAVLTMSTEPQDAAETSKAGALRMRRLARLTPLIPPYVSQLRSCIPNELAAAFVIRDNSSQDFRKL